MIIQVTKIILLLTIIIDILFLSGAMLFLYMLKKNNMLSVQKDLDDFKYYCNLTFILLLITSTIYFLIK